MTKMSMHASSTLRKHDQVTQEKALRSIVEVWCCQPPVTSLRQFGDANSAKSCFSDVVANVLCEKNVWI